MEPEPLPAARPSNLQGLAAEKIIGVSLPSLRDTYSPRLTRKAINIVGNTTHPPLHSAAIREEAADFPGLDQNSKGQLHPSGIREAWVWGLIPGTPVIC